MIILGIDPGSLKTGWAIVEKNQSKIKYLASGVLKFNGKLEFLDRLTDIQSQFEECLSFHKPDIIALESLIYVKSPAALIKLAQTRGVLLGCLLKNYHGKIYEYSPNLVKSTAVGHGHADKQSVQKFITMITGKSNFETDDESDAIAVAICHALQGNLGESSSKRSNSRSLSSSLAHKVKGI